MVFRWLRSARLGPILHLLVSLCLLVPAGRSQDSVTISPSERAKIFEQVWSLINEKYYDSAFNGVDWKAVHDLYRPRLVEVHSNAEFYSLLRQMTGELHDAHTRFRSPEERRLAKHLQSVDPGLGIGQIDGSPVVLSVEPQSEAERSGIEPGMILSTIDGQPFSHELARVSAEVGYSSSGRATTLLTYYWLLSGEPNTSVRLGLIRPDGTSLETSLTRRVVNSAASAPPKLLPSGYAYLELRTFDGESVKNLKHALAAYKDAPGVILDLRGNTGGDFQAVLSAADYFFPEKAALGKVVARSGKKPSLILRVLGVPADLNVGDLGERAYSGPLVILVNEGSASGAELFAAGMQENGRAAVVGRQTCGCLLASVHHRLRNGGELEISEYNVLTAKGRRLEGIGVTPDVEVQLTIEDLRDRHDATLRQAVAILHTSANKRALR
jgi:carboxyl-terminal processing protease